jgi:hypothetical protein
MANAAWTVDLSALTWSMKEKQTVVATFSDVEKAQKARNCLAQAGMLSEVNDESRLQKFWFLSSPLAADKVMVSQKDYDQARSILETADAVNQVLHGELRCPQCGSPNVEYPQFTRKFITTTFVEIFCFLHIIEKTFFCKKCQYTWPTRVALRPKTDALNWPAKNGRLVKKETV